MLHSYVCVYVEQRSCQTLYTLRQDLHSAKMGHIWKEAREKKTLVMANIALLLRCLHLEETVWRTYIKSKWFPNA